MSSSVTQNKVCLKCDHVAIDVRPTATSACPKCGAIYTKLEAKLGTKATIPVYESTQHNSSGTSRSTASAIVIFGITCCVSLAIGYSLGTSATPSYEQLVKASHDKAVLLQAGFDPIEHFTLISPNDALQYESQLPVTVSLLTLEGPKLDELQHLERINLTANLSLYNRTDRVIKGITGLMSFYDPMNNRIYSTKMIINKAVMPQTPIERWPLTITLHAASPESQALLSTPRAQGVFQPIRFLYDDGELVEL